MKKTIQLILPVLFLWGTSSLVVINFKSEIGASQSASLVVFIATIVFYLLSLVTKVNHFDSFKHYKLQDIGKLFVLSLLGLFLYPIFYFLGLHSPRPIEANIINYFWPIIGAVFGFILNLEKISLPKIAAVILGFLGVMITTVSIKGLSNYNFPTFEIQYGKYYLYSAAGAFCYGLYTALLKKFVFTDKDNKEIRPETRFFTLLLISCFLHIFFLRNYNFRFDFFASKAFVFLAIYSTFNFCLAYYLWLRASKMAPITHLAAAAFTIPLISTLVLFLFTNNPIGLNVVLGLGAILLGIYLLQDSKNYISPIHALTISIIIFSLTVLLTKSKAELPIADITGILQIFLGIFAIYSGFILTRVIGQYNEENLLLFSIEESLANLCSANKKDPVLQIKIDQVMTEIIELNSKYDHATANDFQKTEQLKSELSKHVLNLFEKNEPNENISVQYFLNFESAFIKWKYMKTEVISLFEWLILLILSSTMIIVIFFIKNAGPSFDLVKIAFCSTIIQCLIAIRDFDLRRPAKKFDMAASLKRVSSALGKHPYMPYFLIQKYNGIKKGTDHPEIQKFRSSNDNNDIAEIDFYPKKNNLLMVLLITAVILIVTFFYIVVNTDLL